MFIMTGCQRGCQTMDRQFQSSSRKYEVKMYSGGKVVFTDTFTGIVNEAKGSDGIFYFKGDSLIEVSGDYIIKSIN